MAFLDFVQEHKSGQQPSKEIQNLPDNVKAQAVDAARPTAELLDKATQHRPENQDAMPANRADGKEALMHAGGAPGKSQEALSPTDHHKGQTQSQAPSKGRGMSPGR